MNKKLLARRQFLQFLAASPLFMFPGRLLSGRYEHWLTAYLSDQMLSPVTGADGALDVFDF